MNAAEWPGTVTPLEVSTISNTILFQPNGEHESPACCNDLACMRLIQVLEPVVHIRRQHYRRSYRACGVTWQYFHQGMSL